MPHQMADVLLRLGSVLLPQTGQLEGHSDLVVILDSRAYVQHATLCGCEGGICAGMVGGRERYAAAVGRVGIPLGGAMGGGRVEQQQLLL